MKENNEKNPKETTIKSILDFSKSLSAIQINQLKNKIVFHLN